MRSPMLAAACSEARSSASTAKRSAVSRATVSDGRRFADSRRATSTTRRSKPRSPTRSWRSAARVEPAHVGQAEVEQHAVGDARLEVLDRLADRLDVQDLERGERAVGQLLGEQQRVAGAVLDDEQPERIGHAVSGSSASVKWK